MSILMNIFKVKGTYNYLRNRPVLRKIHGRSCLWISAELIVILLSSQISVTFWDRWYYHGLFMWIRQAYDFLLGWSPLPMIYVVLSVLIVRTARWIGHWNKGFIYQFTKAAGGIAALVVLFYVLWGFNYRQVSLQDRLGFDLQQVGQAAIEKEFYRATSVLKKEAESLPVRFTRDEAIMNFKVTDHELRPDVESALAVLQLPNQGRVRVRQVWPDGFLLRWSTAGIYIPQTAEGHIDKGLLSVQKPFTIAHEMAHGYGVTDEGACNFIAWLACSESRDPWIRFGGALTYWRYTAAEMPADSVSLVLHTFPPVVGRSILLIKENDRKYPDLLPQLRDAIYSNYLKRHGVKGGLRSYSYVVMMVQQYLESKSGIHSTE